MLNVNIRNIGSRWQNVRCFAAAVRSPASVRHAFDGHGVLACWWIVVLGLHGPAARNNSPLPNRYECIADGFRFYGLLYRLLAVLLAISAFLCWAWEAAGPFWIFWLSAGSVYLWVVAELAFSGASEFRASKGQRIWNLVVFLCFVSVFLTSVLTAISLEARIAGWLPDVTNTIVTTCMMLFGIGSYVVELAALVAGQSQKKGAPR